MQKDKILSINILRFLAAFAVVFYHYVFMFTQRDYTSYNYGPLWSISHYGYLGVDLFFIISGFVIAMSANGRNLFQFTTSRIARLYPIYWVSVILTCLFVYFFGKDINTFITIKNFLANMTMQPFAFGGFPIDGSYWSLSVELKFYILIGILLLLNSYKYLETISLVLSGFVGLGAVTGVLPFNWSSYFLAGIIFYFIYTEGLSKIRFVSLILSGIASVIYAVSRVPELSSAYHTAFNPVTIASLVISFYVLFLILSLRKFDNILNKYLTDKQKNLLVIFGSLTFPVYLLHQVIGHIALNKLDSFFAHPYWALAITVCFITALSYTLNLFVERQGRDIILKISKKIENGFKGTRS